MKVLNKICRFAASVFGLASLVLFFMPFANIVSGGNNASLVGAILAFGGKATVGGTEYAMAKSSDILFCLLLTVLALILSIFSFKSKKLRYFAPAIGIIDAVYMLVIAVSNPYKFVDKRPLLFSFSQYSRLRIFSSTIILRFSNQRVKSLPS